MSATLGIMKVKMPLPDAVLRLHRIFRNSGHKLYVVGGSVRDFVKSLIEKVVFKPKDHDLVTELHPDDVLSLLRNNHMRVREVGKSFGVVLVNLDGNDYEIATFREDAKTGDGRRPDFVKFSDIKTDSQRRDLTINALYYDIDEEKIIDFHNGLEDLQNQVARFVGNASQRILEDKLRVLRFVRFHSRMNSSDSLDLEGSLACRQLKSIRPEVSDERIRDEFIKGFCSALDPHNYLQILLDLEKMEDIFPGLLYEVPQRLRMVNKSHEATIAQILRCNPVEKIKEKLESLKYTSQEVENVCFLKGIPNYGVMRIVPFKKARKRCSLSDEVILKFSSEFNNQWLIEKMLKFPYPNIKGETLIAEGFEGKTLGEEMERREKDLFLTSLHQ